MRAARSIGPATAIVISLVSTWSAAACTGDDPSINGAAETPDAFVPSNDGGGENEASSSADSAPPPEPPPAPQNKTSWAYYAGTEGFEQLPVAVADDGYSFAATRYTASIPDLPASPNAAAMMLCSSMQTASRCGGKASSPRAAERTSILQRSPSMRQETSISRGRATRQPTSGVASC